jgi:RNA polymerase sigma-54 factor
MLGNGLRHLGEYLIGCLNERGYLTTTIEDAALDCGCSLEEAESALRLLQSCEPLGVGASTIQECLILQLQSSDSLEAKLAKGILKHHFEDFRDRNLRPIMRRYRVLPDVVNAAFDLILGLNPFPGESYRPHVGNEPRGFAAKPDLAFHHMETGWIVEVVGESDHMLAVSRSYRRRHVELQHGTRASKSEKQHVGEYIERASRFIDAIEQRHRTLRRIGETLLQHQAGFIATGEYRFLTPLTRTKLARELDLHESTISRATQGKFVQLANGEVVQFDVFFKPALRVQKLIEEILAHENPGRPLSDERIAEMLAEKGVIVARRTVNKYRDRNKQLSSRRRKSA